MASHEIIHEVSRKHRNALVAKISISLEKSSMSNKKLPIISYCGMNCCSIILFSFLNEPSGCLILVYAAKPVTGALLRFLGNSFGFWKLIKLWCQNDNDFPNEYHATNAWCYLMQLISHSQIETCSGEI